MAFDKDKSNDNKFAYEFMKDPCVINTRGDAGWQLEFNVIKWSPSDLEERYDIRVWAPDHKKMGKGISLTKPEISKLKDILNADESI